jgi:hypothetical protein
MVDHVEQHMNRNEGEEHRRSPRPSLPATKAHHQAPTHVFYPVDVGGVGMRDLGGGGVVEHLVVQGDRARVALTASSNTYTT